jgi:hypothetical protein
MANEWRIKRGDVKGGISGELLDGCEIRQNDDGTVDFLAVLATTAGPEYAFPQFAYRGLIWNVGINTFEFGPDGNEVEGRWSNNAPKLPGEEEGTYTGQAGPGGGVEESGEEDAASAHA